MTKVAKRLKMKKVTLQLEKKVMEVRKKKNSHKWQIAEKWIAAKNV